MKTANVMSSVSGVTLPVFGVVAALLIAAILFKIRLPWLESDRAALGALVVVGMAMCTPAMQIEVYGWLQPLQVAGVILGGLGLLVAAAVFLGIPVPLIADERAAAIALAVIMAAKIGLAAMRSPFA